MKSMLPAFALPVILAASICMAPAAFGQQTPITVMADKESYRNHDAIVVTGNVTDLLPTQLSLWINAPNTGNIVYVDQISVAPDKTFGTTVCAGGPLWGAGGTYTMTVQYGYDAHRASTTFEYGWVIYEYGLFTTPPQPPGYDGIVSFEITGADVNSIVPPDVASTRAEVLWKITGADVHSIVPAVETDSLLVNLVAYDETFLQQEQGPCNSGDARQKIPTETDDGSLTIHIPRSIADATLDDGSDDQYFVLVDGEEREFQEVTTEDFRILTIEFEAGTEQIEIIGTWVIPEFGAITAMVLAVAIVSVIAVSSRSRLSVVT